MVMKALTMMTVCVIPYTILSGLFGMNVTVPWKTDNEPSIGPFFGIVGLCTLISLFAIYTFKRLKWV